MTTNMLTDPAFAGRRDESDLTNYPYSTYKDKSSPSANDGTPIALAAKFWKDIDGFRQYLLRIAKRVPNGTADTAIDSQIAESIFSVFGVGYTSYHPDDSYGDFNNPYGYNSYNSVGHSMGQLNGYELLSELKNGGVRFGGSTPGDVAVVTRTEQYDITGLTLFAVDTITTSGSTLYAYRYAPSTLFELTGIPLNSKIHNVRVISKQSSVGSTISQFNCKIKHDGVTWPTIEKGTFILPDSEFFSNDVVIQVEYDPTDLTTV